MCEHVVARHPNVIIQHSVFCSLAHGKVMCVKENNQHIK